VRGRNENTQKEEGKMSFSVWHDFHSRFLFFFLIKKKGDLIPRYLERCSNLQRIRLDNTNAAGDVATLFANKVHKLFWFSTVLKMCF
jgi:hypothetical protein